MSNQELTVALRLFLESRGLDAGLQRTGRNWSSTTQRMGRDMERVNRLIGSVQQRVAALGLGFGALQNQRLSARLDQDLQRIGQTAGATRDQVKGMREELFALSRQTGNPIDGLRNSVATLVAANMSWDQATQANRAINPASRVSGAEPSVLANALTVGASSFQIDLSQPGKAVEMLDQMVVAGEAGKAELEDLATIFGVAGNAAARANLKFKDTLALIEILAQTTPIAQLPVMVESTLRLFNNRAYGRRAEKASGVRFFDESGASRNPVEILQELAGKVQAAPNDQARATLLDRLFKGADITTVTGLMALFKDGELQKMRDIARQLDDASGAVARKLPWAMENAVAQGERLRTVMRKVGDDFAMPINKAIADTIEFSMRSKREGGMGMSNGEMVGAAGAALVGGSMLAALARSRLGGIFGDSASTAIGIAQGKALEHAAGVTPVFVTNWPSSVGGGAGAAAAAAAGAAAGGKLPRALTPSPLPMLAVAAAGFAGVKTGEWIYNKFLDHTAFADKLGGAIASAMATLGSDTARDAINARRAPTERAEIRVLLDQNGRLKVAGVDTTDGVDLSVGTGMLPLGTY
jgi:hypothetical protein